MTQATSPGSMGTASKVVKSPGCREGKIKFGIQGCPLLPRGTLGNSLSLEPWSPLLYSKGGSLYPTGTVGYSIFELSSFVKSEAHSENQCVIWVLWGSRSQDIITSASSMKDKEERKQE